KQYVAATNTGGMTGSDTSNDEVTAFALSGGTDAAAAIAPQGPARVVGSSRGTDAPATPPPGAGLDLINQRCVACHPATQIFSAQRKTPREWTRTVRNMAARGAELSPAEIKAISDYLAQHFGADPGGADPE